ncbi:MAG: hypothetical protein QG553_176 [Patescibacteria group bacterium]|nr:hypothetical protein [Patescibacteria group bacterium]
MAVYDDQDTRSPDTLKHTPKSDAASQNPKELETQAGQSAVNNKKASEALGAEQLKSSEQSSAEEPSLFNASAGGGKSFSGKGSFLRNKKVLAAGAGGGGVFVVAIIVLVFLASLKPVHFGQALSTAGFARLQIVLRQRAAQNLFDAAVVQGEGSAVLDKRTLTERLRRINPEKQLKALGTENKLKLDMDKGKTWTGRGVNEFKGVTIDGKTVSLDEIAKKNGFESWADANSVKNKLKVRERMTIKSEFVTQVKYGVENTLRIDKRYVRSSVYDGIRQTSGIKMTRWAQRAREYIGKTPKEAYAENRKQSFNNTAPDSVGATDPTTEDTIKKSRENIVKSIDDGATGDIVTSSINKAAGDAQFAKATSTVSTAVLASTLACMVNQAASKLDEATEINQENSQRLAHEAMTGADQIRRGETTAEVVAADGKRWDGADASPEYQRQMNGRTDYPEPDDYYVPSVAPKIDPTIVDVIDLVTSPSTLVPGANLTPLGDEIDEKFCGFMLHPAGQVAIAGTEIIGQAVLATASGGTTAVAGEAAEQTALRTFGTKVIQGFGQAARGFFSKEGAAQVAGFTIVQLALDYSVQLLGGISYSGTEEGANLFSKSTVGADSLEKENLRQGFRARPLTDQEVQESDEDAQLALLEQNQNRPWSERYFATSNPYSLVSMAAGSTPGSINTASQKVGSWFSSVGNLFNPSRMLGTPKLAQAATPVNHHGVPQWGFSRAELDKLYNDPSYSLEENEAWIIAQGGLEKVQKELDDALGNAVESCFTAKKVTEVPGGCTADKLSTEKAFRYRIYKGLDPYVVNMLEEDLTPKAGPNDASAASAGTITTEIVAGDTSNQTCPVGDDAGVGDGYENGKLFKIRLCKVQGSLVNSQYANNFNNMLNAAKAAGVELGGGGGFRTMDQQVATRIANHCPDVYNSPAKSCSPQTARPGYSNHQMGFANDFLCGKTIISSRGSPCFKWMAANAASFGYINLPAEPWHWSRDGR